LELGGKSPCLVDETANIDLAAKRIVWGKLVNGGQTCVAPDYVLVHTSVKRALIERMKHYIARFYGEKPLENPDYAKIINQKHFERLCGLMRDEHLAAGGEVNTNTLQIAPAILDEATWDSPVMGEEIFGPLLPVIAYEEMEQAIAAIRARPKPLAFYFFTSDASREKDIFPRLAFGGGCVNDTLIHVGTHHLPFGGVGESGMGNYHGRTSFDAFTHYKGVAKKSLLIDLPIRFPPFREERFSFVRMLSRRK
jgi:aldehyde dehydrogenase (NAD+)